MPDCLAGWVPRVPVDAIASASAAEAAVEALNRRVAGAGPHALDAFAYVLLRVEAVASLRIEGIEVSPRRLLTAEAERRAGGRSSDRTAAEVLANLEAMEEAIRSAARGGPLHTDDLLKVHRRLMSAVPHPDLGGWIRDTQNWIAASPYSPLGASFVPAPPEEVPPLVADLMAYVNRTDLPPLIQAGIAQARFEIIHPFADGNGRTGRALIHGFLRRREVTPAFVPPISAVLARSTDSYIGGLSAWRHVGSADDPARDHAAEQWLGMFLEAAYDACQEAHSYLDAVADLEADLRLRAGSVRLGSSADRLLSLLPARPVSSVDSAAAVIERSTVATGQAVNQLTESGVLVVRSVGKQRYRIFEAPDVTRLITRLDRRLSILGAP